MPFHTDKQRKAVMAKLKGNSTRSDTKPTIIGRLRKKFRPTAEEQVQARGARIKKEGEELEEEKRTARQLQLEAKVETERERVGAEIREARGKLRKIDVERRERKLAPLRKVESRIKGGFIQLKKASAKARARERARPRPREAPAREETGFFGINGSNGTSRKRSKKQPKESLPFGIEF